MIRKLLLASVFAASAGAAFAADLPRNKGPVAAPYMAPAPMFTGTGFYMGLNAGGAFSSKIGRAHV